MRASLAALTLLVWSAGAEAACRQALALGLDVSGSVDTLEYRLQLDGLASALTRPEVQEAILAFPAAPVRLFVFEWAGQGAQRVVQDWVALAGPADLAGVAARLRATTRRPLDPSTAIGEAMLFGAGALARQAGCWRRTLDLSGDGKSNTGPRPRDLAGAAALQGVTVNGLVVGADDVPGTDRRQAEVADIWAYYTVRVIRGPDAFVEVAVGFRDFEAAMARKLLKELQTMAVGSVQ